jgi:hypothetical protein
MTAGPGLRLETALVNALQQIFSLTRRIARTVTPDRASGTTPAHDQQSPHGGPHDVTF